MRENVREKEKLWGFAKKKVVVAVPAEAGITLSVPNTITIIIWV